MVVFVVQADDNNDIIGIYTNARDAEDNKEHPTRRTWHVTEHEVIGTVDISPSAATARLRMPASRGPRRDAIVEVLKCHSNVALYGANDIPLSLIAHSVALAILDALDKVDSEKREKINASTPPVHTGDGETSFTEASQPRPSSARG